jgi:pimeloyl-ACP methyl ester carboxylesterase
MRSTVQYISTIFFVLLFFGCAEIGGQPKLILDGDDFFGRPWPDDARTQDGHPDMDGFPQLGEIELIDTYMASIEGLNGFGTNAPIYLPLNARPKKLPTPQDTATIDGPLWLLDIDPDSAERGTIIPLSSRFQEVETLWQRGNLLAVQPVWGFPLQPRTTYALVLSTDFIAPVQDWQVKGNWSALNSALLELRVDPDRVAFAVQFTTQDPVGEMARFEERISNDLSTPALDQTVDLFKNSGLVGAYEGTMWVPMWQHGTKPYFSSGGAFQFDGDGMPILYEWEQVLFTVSIPHGDMPDDGWPVTIYGHGTGGNSRGFASGSSALSPARVLAEAGIAGFGISLPLHGDRSTSLDPALVSFNYLNPDSARAVFRQGALDQLYLAEILTARQHAFDLSDGTIAQLDPDRVAYMGHSHGGLIGAIAGPFFGERLKAIFLSGAGGGLSTTVVTRDAGDFDIQGVLESALSFSADDELVESHPVIAMVQTLAEVTDPINYAPYWNRRTPYWETTPISVLMTEGLNDIQTPPDTAEALAAAGHLPLLAPATHVSLAHSLQNEGTHATPAINNRQSWSDERVTAGLAQYEDDDHFAIFNNEDAAALYQQFLKSALDGNPPEIQDL